MRLNLENNAELFETDDFYVRLADIPMDPAKEGSPSVLGYEVVLAPAAVVQGATRSLATAIQAAFQSQQTLDQVRLAISQDGEAASQDGEAASQDGEAASQQQATGLASVLDFPLDDGEDPEVH